MKIQKTVFIGLASSFVIFPSFAAEHGFPQNDLEKKPDYSDRIEAPHAIDRPITPMKLQKTLSI
jgi:hypothetical protein